MVYSSTTANNTYRCIRGSYGTYTNVNRVADVVSTINTTGGGFRPVLNYIESDISSEVI